MEGDARITLSRDQNMAVLRDGTRLVAAPCPWGWSRCGICRAKQRPSGCSVNADSQSEVRCLPDFRRDRRAVYWREEA